MTNFSLVTLTRLLLCSDRDDDHGYSRYRDPSASLLLPGVPLPAPDVLLQVPLLQEQPALWRLRLRPQRHVSVLQEWRQVSHDLHVSVLQEWRQASHDLHVSVLQEWRQVSHDSVRATRVAASESWLTCVRDIRVTSSESWHTCVHATRVASSESWLTCVRATRVALVSSDLHVSVQEKRY